jgi:hypothetical protein
MWQAKTKASTRNLMIKFQEPVIQNNHPKNIGYYYLVKYLHITTHKAVQNQQ